MFHESLLISSDFPVRKISIMVMGNSGARKFFFQFILLPFPFCHRKKNIRLKSYNVFRIKKNIFLYPLFHKVLLKMTNGKKRLAN